MTFLRTFLGNHEKLNFLGNFGQLVESPTYEMEGRLFEGGGGGGNRGFTVFEPRGCRYTVNFLLSSPGGFFISNTFETGAVI